MGYTANDMIWVRPNHGGHKYFGRRWLGIFTSTLKGVGDVTRSRWNIAPSKIPFQTPKSIQEPLVPGAQTAESWHILPQEMPWSPGFPSFFSGFLLQPWGVATRSVERPLATARSTSPGGACDARGRTWEVSPQVRLSSTSSWAARMRHCWRRRTGWVGRCGTWGKHLATNRPTVYLVMVGFSFGGVLCGWGFGTIFDLGRIAGDVNAFQTNYDI